MSANIVNLKSVDIKEWLKDDRNVYIGRSADGKGEWGNKYKLKDYEYNRTKVLALYEEDLLSNKELLRRVPSLKGKILGCWCSPEQCHGEVLHRQAGNIPVYDSSTNNVKTIMASDNCYCVLHSLTLYN